jgi:hypothetical protein
MRKAFIGGSAVLVGVLVLSSGVMGQTPKSPAVKSPWKYYPTDVPEGDGGPAPKRDLSGTWNGPGSSPAVPRGGGAERPDPTPLALAIMKDRKPIGRFGPAGTNDPTARFCDPVGFPQTLTNEGRAVSFASMPNRVVVLQQYQDTWREIWTDGRALPTDVGGSDRDALDPTFMGYSVGHWEDDYNFVVDTTGVDERTWLNNQGFPHSTDMRVQERYTRIDHNNMKLTVTVTDPKMFTKPFSMGTFNYKWNPNQKMNEWFCVPSDQIKYLTEQGDPAGSFPELPAQRAGQGGGGGRGGRGGGQ